MVRGAKTAVSGQYLYVMNRAHLLVKSMLNWFKKLKTFVLQNIPAETLPLSVSLLYEYTRNMIDS